MSRAVLVNLGTAAKRAALEVAWTQWSCLTHAAAASDLRSVTSIVDAEVLVVASLVLQDDERRLRDLLAALARQHSRLLSIHRMQAICALFPEPAAPLLHEFASWATHPSWSRLAMLAEVSTAATPRDKDIGPLRLLHAPMLQLRLRTAFGVGLKSDLLCYLLGQHEHLSTTADLAGALGYTERNTRAAADDLVTAGLAIRDDYSPRTTYSVRGGAWSALLVAHAAAEPTTPRQLPRWQNWRDAFAFLAHVVATANRADEGWTDYVIESRARDLVESHYPVLIRGRTLVWDEAVAREPSGLRALKQIVSQTVEAMQASL
jgi:hypothetical protein